MCAPACRGKSRRGLLLVTAVVVLLGSFIAVLAPAASAAAVACTSKSHPAVAAAMTRDIQAARRGRSSTVALWAKLGHSYLQHFLNLAGMRQTVLGPGGYWGLTQVTAHDETLLLRLLLTASTVLTGNSRAPMRWTTRPCPTGLPPSRPSPGSSIAT